MAAAPAADQLGHVARADDVGLARQQRQLRVEALGGRAPERAIPRLGGRVADAVVVEHQHAVPGRQPPQQAAQRRPVEQRSDALGARRHQAPAGATATGATASSRRPITGGLPVLPVCFGSGPGAEPQSAEVRDALVDAVGLVHLDLDRADVAGPVGLLAQDALLGPLDVHLHVVDDRRAGEARQQRVEAERRDGVLAAGRRRVLVDVEGELVAAAARVADLAVVDPDGGVDELGARRPRRDVGAAQLGVLAVELDADHARQRADRREVGHRAADVGAEVPDRADARRVDLRRRQVVGWQEGVGQRPHVSGAGADPEALAAERTQPQLDLLARAVRSRRQPAAQRGEVGAERGALEQAGDAIGARERTSSHACAESSRLPSVRVEAGAMGGTILHRRSNTPTLQARDRR